MGATTVDVSNALEAARALGAALGMLQPGRFGEITVAFNSGEVTVVRHRVVLKVSDLRALPVGVDSTA